MISLGTTSGGKSSAADLMPETISPCPNKAGTQINSMTTDIAKAAASAHPHELAFVLMRSTNIAKAPAHDHSYIPSPQLSALRDSDSED